MSDFGAQNELQAPKGKFRVIGVDTYEGPNADYLIGDFDSEDEAHEAATENSGPMNPVYIYDDKGKLLQ